MVRLLLRRGADVRPFGFTSPLDYAVENGHEKTAEVLRSHFAE